VPSARVWLDAIVDHGVHVGEPVRFVRSWQRFVDTLLPDVLVDHLLALQRDELIPGRHYSAVLTVLDALVSFLSGRAPPEVAAVGKHARLEVDLVLEDISELGEVGQVPFGLVQFIDTAVPEVNIDGLALLSDGDLASDDHLVLHHLSFVAVGLVRSVLRSFVLAMLARSTVLGQILLEDVAISLADQERGNLNGSTAAVVSHDQVGSFLAGLVVHDHSHHASEVLDILGLLYEVTAASVDEDDLLVSAVAPLLEEVRVEVLLLEGLATILVGYWVVGSATDVNAIGEDSVVTETGFDESRL